MSPWTWAAAHPSPSPSPRANPHRPWSLPPSLVLGRWLAASPNVHAAPTWGKALIPAWLASARLSWELARRPPSVAPSHLPHFHFLLIFPPTAHSRRPSSLACAWPPAPLLPLSIWPGLLVSLPPLPPIFPFPSLASTRLRLDSPDRLTNLNLLPPHSLFLVIAKTSARVLVYCCWGFFPLRSSPIA